MKRVKAAIPRNQETRQFQDRQTKKWRFVGQWIVWGLMYILAFYLGNLAGEYVATKMPIASFQIPQLLLPNVHITWNGFNTSEFLKPSKTSEVAHTKPVIVEGNVISMPIEGASAEEQKQFIGEIGKLAKATSSVGVSDRCEFQPAIVLGTRGSAFTFINKSAQPHSVQLGFQNPQTIESFRSITAKFSDPQGAYPISCDGAIEGFYLVK